MKINKKLSILVGVSVVFVLLGIVGAVQAGPYVPQGPFVSPAPGSGVPAPPNVPGKEYADMPNKGQLPPPNLIPGQSLLWDGAGGIMNGINYGNTVDAMANVGDALFDSVINNTSALLVSAKGDPIAPIMYETIPGGVGIWAMPPQIDQHGVTDLTALEVWGPEMYPDANRYSLAGDPGWSVYAFPGGGLVTPQQIATAIGAPNLTVDLDALMVNGETYLFSIAPAGPFDGGEIWVWNSANPAPGSASFLNHGGHLWDTAFNVTGILGSEDVDALEAVSTPEPGTLLMFVLGLLGLVGWRGRFHR